MFTFRLEDPDSEEFYDYLKFGVPFRQADKYFYFHNSRLQPQKVMYMQVKILESFSILGFEHGATDSEIKKRHTRDFQFSTVKHGKLISHIINLQHVKLIWQIRYPVISKPSRVVHRLKHTKDARDVHSEGLENITYEMSPYFRSKKSAGSEAKEEKICQPETEVQPYNKSKVELQQLLKKKSFKNSGMLLPYPNDADSCSFSCFLENLQAFLGKIGAYGTLHVLTVKSLWKLISVGSSHIPHGNEVDLDELKKMPTDYGAIKELATKAIKRNKLKSNVVCKFRLPFCCSRPKNDKAKIDPGTICSTRKAKSFSQRRQLYVKHGISWSPREFDANVNEQCPIKYSTSINDVFAILEPPTKHNHDQEHGEREPILINRACYIDSEQQKRVQLLAIRELGMDSLADGQVQIISLNTSQTLDLTDDQEAIDTLREVYDDDVEQLDLLVEWRLRKRLKGDSKKIDFSQVISMKKYTRKRTWNSTYKVLLELRPCTYLSIGNLRAANNLMDEIDKLAGAKEVEFPVSELM
ncbi:Peptidase S9A/B/C, oligopeptidase, N-terminal beta-propeller [Artemisia annua]|uniref:Peptidase S9A/B/C, oligopeptidase, N-terminal beta-propeller n=1 Tax=Artemisia annua TaxID=35608 RepID=A0A2U1ND63_ARTAN|nr:Peptidase S9A/B/C, oligopeptidase, N-terminal beta-propeller [Artemisia annua]